MATYKTPNMQELLEVGAHFGHQVRRCNPKMKPYIFGERDGVNILDLAKTEQLLKEASQAAYELGKLGKVLLIVGTKKQAKEIVKGLAEEVNTPYINSHWVGGLLTNFDEIHKNLKKLIELKTEQDQGKLTRYTKKERMLIDKKLKKFAAELGGITNLITIPDAIFLLDTVADATAVREAKRVGVTLLGIADTNSDPSVLDYPIPANDDGIKSIKLISETVVKAYGEGKKAGVNKEQVEPKISGESGIKEDEAVVEEAAAIEEQVEKEIVSESSGKQAPSLK